MFAINHATTALIIKKKFPESPMLLLPICAIHGVAVGTVQLLGI
jgi:hypothetical protein